MVYCERLGENVLRFFAKWTQNLFTLQIKWALFAGAEKDED